MNYALKYQLEEKNEGYFIPWEGKLKFRGNYQVVPVDVSSPYIEEALDFAVQMTFAKAGAHKDYRQGSNYHRTLVEILINTFQGKIAEFAAYQASKELGKEVSYPDLSVSSLGTWDSGDLIIDGEEVSVKSAKYFSNVLFLEVADWDDNGLYVPDNQTAPYDYFLFVRVQLPDKFHELANETFPESVTSQEVYDRALGLIGTTVLCDIVGQLKHGVFKKHVIGKQQLIRQGQKFQRTEMDVSNYYVCAKDLWKFK